MQTHPIQLAGEEVQSDITRRPDRRGGGGRCPAGIIAVLVCLTATVSRGEESPRRLYVPAEHLDLLLSQDQGGVLLPRAEFERLLREASAAATTVPRTPAADAVVTSADYAAQVVGERLQLVIDIRATHFGPSWGSVALAVGGLGIESATTGDEPALVSRGETPEVLRWLIREAGESTLRLEASLPLQVVGSDRVAALSLAGAPAGELRVRLPAGKHLQVGAAAVKRPAAADAEAEYIVAVGGQSTIELRITDRSSESRTDALTFAQTAYGLAVAPGEVTWTARTSLQVVGRTIDRLLANVPRELEITAVESTGLESWELADAADPTRTTITLNWRQGFEGQRSILFRGVVRAQNGDRWQAPDLRIEDVASHTGVIEIQYPAGVRVQVQSLEGVRASAAEATSPGPRALTPAAAVPRGRLHFQVWQQDFELTFSTEVKPRELHAAMTNLVDAADDGLRLFTLVDVSSRLDVLFDVQLTLPAEWEVQELSVGGTPVEWTSRPLAAGINELHVPLTPPAAAGETRKVRLTARRLLEQWPVEAQPVRFALPEVRLPHASLVEALYGVTGEDDLLLAPVDVSGLDPAQGADLAALERQLAGSGRTLRLGFAYQDTSFAAQVEAMRKPTRISAATLTFLQLDRETVTTQLETQVRIEGGGVRELRVALPEEAGSDVQFRLLTAAVLLSRGDAAESIAAPRIIEQQAAPPQEGRREWLLKFDQRLSGDAVLATEVRQPRGDAAEFTPLVLSVVGAERQNGHIAVIAGEDQRVVLTAQDAAGAPLPLIDPVDFPPSFTYSAARLPLNRRRIVASVQYLQPGYTVRVSDQRYERTAVPTAVCPRAEYQTVLTSTGELQQEATLTIAAVGVQGLEIRLPQGQHLSAATIDGVPVEVRRDGDALTLPLSGGSAAGGTREVRLQYRGTMTETGRVRQTPPKLAVVTGQGSPQPLEVLEQNWIVHHAPDTLLVESRGRFHSERELNAGTLLSRLAELWALPTRQEATTMGVIAGLVLLLVALGTWSLKRFGVIATMAGVIVLAVVGGVQWLPRVEQAARVAGGAPAATYFSDDSMSLSERDLAEFKSQPVQSAVTGAPHSGPQEVPALAGTAVPPPPAAEPSMTPQYGNTFRSSGAVRSPGAVFDAPATAPGRAPFGRSGAAGGERGAATPDVNLRMRQGGFDAQAPTFGGGFAGQDREVAPGAEQAPAARRFDGSPDARFGDGLWLDRSIAQQEAAGRALLADAPPTEGAAADDAFSRPAPQMELAAQKDRGALLSLALALEPPGNFRSERFHYAGSETDPGELALVVDVADRRRQQMVTSAVAAGVLLLAWWLRCTSPAARGLLGVLLIAGPLLLSPLALAATVAVTDGLFVGGLLAVGLWLLLAVLHWLPTCCQRGCCHWMRKKQNTGSTPGGTPAEGASPAATATLLGWAVVATSSGLLCAEERPPAPEAGRPVVIVPYDPGQDPLAAEQVLVPRAYYLQLWKQARPGEQLPEPPPVGGVVSAAAYRAELEPGEGRDHTVRVVARFVLRQLGDKATRLELPLAPTAIESARLDDAPANLVSDDSGSQLAIVLSRPGLHLLDVTFRVRAQEVTAEAGRFVLPLRPVASGRLSFVVPGGESTEVRINGASDAFRLREVDGVRLVEAPIDRGGDVTVSWRPPTTRGAGEGSVQVESTIGATVDDAGLTVRHRFRYAVSQGALAEVQFTAPAAARIKRIAGADVAGWEQSEEGGVRRLQVFLRRDVRDSTSLDLDLFQPLSLTEAPSAVDVPTLEPVGIRRETGDVAVFAEPQLAAQSDAGAGLRQVNVSTFTMDAALTQPGATARFAYRFDARPIRLPLTLSRRRPETRVFSEHGVQVLPRKLKLASRLQYDLREAPQGTLSLSLPAGYLPLNVQGDYLTDWWVDDADGARVLTVELDQPRTGRVQVLLEGTQPRDPALNGVTLSVPQPVGVQRQESQLGVWIDDAYTATISDAGDWRALDVSALSEVIRQLRTSRAQFGFRSTQGAPGGIGLLLDRATAELSADVLVLAAVSDASLDYGLTFRWRIERAASDSFVVTTPDWLGSQVEFTGAGIRQVQSTARADGGRAWRITLHDPVRGEYLLSASATLPLPADGLVRLPDVRSLSPAQAEAEAPELTVQRRFGLLVNLSDVHRLSEVDAAAIVRADRTRLPLKAPPALLERAVEVVTLPPGRPLPEWRLTSTAGTQEASATVLLADLRTVVAHDGSWRTQAEYRVRNRGRQFLAILPPAGSRLLSVIVAERASQAIEQQVGGERMWLAPLPATSMVDLSFVVRVVLAGRLPSALPEGWSPAGREVELPAPQVASVQQSPEFGLPVLQTLWRVELPSDVQATLVESGGRSNLTPGDSSAAEQAYGKFNLEELKSQLSLSYSVESSRRSLSESHLSNLGIAVQNFQQQGGVLKGEEEELVEKASERLRELQLQIADKDADGGSLDRNDFGRNFIADNNRDILLFNGIAVDPSATLDEALDFSRNRAIVDELSKAKSSVVESRASESREQARKKLQDQSLFDAVRESDAAGFWFRSGSLASGGRVERNLGKALAEQERQQALPQSRAAAEAGEVIDVAGRGEEWTQAGGLSLDVVLPYSGRELTFTKVGGSPKLTLAVRPQATLSRTWSMLMGLACLLAGIAAVRGLARPAGQRGNLSVVLAGVGLALVLLAPAPVRYVGLLALLAGASCLLARRVAAVHAR